ncbi:MAG: glycosyltransferase family 9 protein [Verrucomicrobia bacterium]|nr:glycosyltransferase family 9 protein [Verrucomicrobiota bacterium]
MNPDILRRIDRVAGSALCRILGLLTLGHKRKPSKAVPKKILIIKLTEMGSTVLALPALRELREEWPDAEWFFLVFRGSRAILDALEITSPENIIEIDDRSMRAGISSAWRSMLTLRREKPCIAIDFDFFSRLTAVFSFVVCRGLRVGYQPFHAPGRERGRLLTHRVVYSPVQHTSSTFLALTRSVTHKSDGEPYYRGALTDADFTLPEFTPSETDLAEVKNMLMSADMMIGKRILLISPDASKLLPLRRWPRKRYVETIHRLLAEDDSLWIILIGGEDEQEEADAICAKAANSRLINLAGKTTFQQFLGLCSMASLLLCNDGGPAHFAGLVALRTVVLFGPESPDLYRPLSDRARILYKSLPCSPCVHAFNAKRSACHRAVCLEQITVDEVVAAVREELGASCP